MFITNITVLDISHLSNLVRKYLQYQVCLVYRGFPSVTVLSLYLRVFVYLKAVEVSRVQDGHPAEILQ